MKARDVDNAITDAVEPLSTGDFVTFPSLRKRANLTSDVTTRRLVNSIKRLQTNGVLKFFGNGLVSTPDTAYTLKG